LTAEPPSRLLVPVLVLIGTVTSVVGALGAPLLPTIARTDHVTLGQAQWSLTITMLVGAVVAPVLGRLGDGPARRRVILTALGAVVLGSVLAGLSGDNFGLLLAGRALHGFGLGLMPLTMAVARDHLPDSQSGPTIALLSVATVAGAGLGFPITGLLNDNVGLHAPFWFGAIVVGAALLAAWPVIPPSHHLERRPLDIAGGVMLALALVGLLIGITEAQSWGWTAPATIALLAGGAVLAVAWVWRELHTSRPLVEIRLLRHPSVLVSNATAFLIAMALYMFLPALTDFVQTPRSEGYGFGVSVVVAGLMIVPFSVLGASMSRVAAALGRRVGQERVVPLGCLVLVVAVGMFGVAGGQVWEAFLAMGLAGVGMGFTFAAMPGLIVRAVPADETGSALGFYQVVRYVGFAVGSAISAAILAGFTPAASIVPERTGFTVTFAVSAAICLLAAVASATLARPRTLRDRAATDELAAITSAEESAAEVVFE
jgi:predicted MFS family arabinose efflux permease